MLKMKKLSENRVHLIYIVKNILLIGLLTLFIQFPYIIKLKKANVSTTDYKIAAEIIKTNASSLSTSIAIPPATELNNNNTNDNNITIKKNNKKNIYKKFLKIFRVLFEFRLPGISILFTFLLAFSIVYFTKNISFVYIPILILWLITYFGTKVDLLFNMGIISYRFSLMLIFSSLILLAMTINVLLSFIKNKLGKFLFVITILFSFLSVNLPLIFNITLLRNYTLNQEQLQILKNIYEKITIDTQPKPLTFVVNGISFEHFDKTSRYLRNDLFFTSFDENRIINSYNTNHVNFVIFDHFKIRSKGPDLNAVVNTNLELYEKSKHFDKIDEIINPYMHLSIFKYVPDSSAQKNHFAIKKIDCSRNKNCQKDFEKQIGSINQGDSQNWVIEISDLSDNIIITESIKTKNSIISLSYYQKKPLSHNTRKITLLNIPERKNKQVATIIHIPKAKLLIKHKGFAINRKELQKEDVNELILFGKVNSNTIQYTYISTANLKMLTSLLFVVLILLCYLISIILTKKRDSSQPLMEFDNAKAKKLIISLIVFILIDMLFFNIIFIHFYKTLLHL